MEKVGENCIKKTEKVGKNSIEKTEKVGFSFCCFL